MFFFRFHVTPKPDTQLAAEFAGAYVNSWIYFKDEWGAKCLAQIAIDQEGWDVQSVETEGATGRHLYTGEEPEYANVQQAEQDGWSFLYECYDHETAAARASEAAESSTEGDGMEDSGLNNEAGEVSEETNAEEGAPRQEQTATS